MVKDEMRNVTARQEQGFKCWLWTEPGDGQLELITSVNQSTWWATCTDGHGYPRSYSCCPDSTVHCFESEAERIQIEQEMKAALAARREVRRQR